MRALLTPATGYLGSRLVGALVREGFEVLTPAEDLNELQRIDVAYHLDHEDQHSTAENRISAAVFGLRAARAGARRIIFLGGVLPQEPFDDVAGQDEVGRELGGTGVDLVWLRAAAIIGAGSSWYEMIRYLADRWPVVPIPASINHDVAPIAVDDVLRYLVAAAHIPPGHYEITGPETLSYQQVFSAYAKAAGLTRLVLPTPGVPTGLTRVVAGRLTPLPPALTHDLLEGMRPTVTGDRLPIRAVVPDPLEGLTTVAAAMARAQARDGTGRDDLPAVDELPDPLRLAATDPSWAGGDRNETHREKVVHARADKVWAVVETIGGKNGFFSWPLAWEVRIELDKLAGGPGFTQHRADPNHLTVGDTIDFLTVVAVENSRYVRFATDRQTPGTGSLEIWIEPTDHTADIADTDDTDDTDDPAADPVELHLRARWLPHGVEGRLYWLALKPFHLIIFPAMLNKIAALAEAG